MITYEVNRAELELVEKKLGDMKSKAPQVFKNAVNKTARQARKRIAQSAKGAYTVTREGEKYKLKISYKTVVGTTISNSYYAEISESTLTLTQIGLESLSVKYTRAQS